jgi:hypothetical protein
MTGLEAEAAPIVAIASVVIALLLALAVLAAAWPID